MSIDHEREAKWQRPPWNCAADGYLNQGIRDRCRNCGRPRPGETTQQLTTAITALDTTWRADRSAMLPLTQLSSRTSSALIELLDAYRSVQAAGLHPALLRPNTISALRAVIPGIRSLCPELLTDLAPLLQPPPPRNG